MSYQNNLPETPTVQEAIENAETKEYREAKNERVSKIKQGQRYRANKNGDKYVCACELYSDILTEEQQQLLHTISADNTWQDKNQYDENLLTELVNKSMLKIKDDKTKITSKAGAYPRYRRLAADGLSFTITTHKFQPRNMLHPTENRAISISEGLALQSFKEEFELKTDYITHKRELIGNAVPPRLAEKIGDCLRKQIE